MTVRVRLCVLSAFAACLTAVPVAYALAGPSTSPSATIPTSSSELAAGKKLYRQYCGQCHSLEQALAAGFGTTNGLGQNGGPSFNTLRVSFNLAIEAITMVLPGHEIVNKRLSWTQLTEIAAFVANATKDNPYAARITDA